MSTVSVTASNPVQDVKSPRAPIVYFASFLAAFLISGACFYFIKPAFVMKKDANGNLIKDTVKILIYSFVIGLVGMGMGMFFYSR